MTGEKVMLDTEGECPSPSEASWLPCDSSASEVGLQMGFVTVPQTGKDLRSDPQTAVCVNVSVV